MRDRTEDGAQVVAQGPVRMVTVRTVIREVSEMTFVGSEYVVPRGLRLGRRGRV